MSARSALIHDLPCVACSMDGNPQPNETEMHHLTLGGLHGKPRRGEDQSVPLCRYHHRGVLPRGMTGSQALKKYGPSYAKSPKAFRKRYLGDEFMLSMTNNCIEATP
jgi:hypothetical protein